MSIRREVYCSCVDGPSRPSDESGRIVFYTTDDFKLVYQFVDSRFQPPVLIPLDCFELSIKYFVKGRPEIYQVVKRGINLVNCVIIEEDSVIKAILDNHGLHAGHLFAEFTFKFPDPDFPDRFGTSVCLEDTGITLINDQY